MVDITLYGARIFGSILAIGLHVLAYTYIDKLQKIDCGCAQDKHLTHMKYFLLALVAYLAVTMFIPIPDITGSNSTLIMGFKLMEYVVTAFSLVYYIYVIMYVNRLVKSKCECSEDIRREITYAYAILQLVMLGIMLVVVLIQGASIYASPLKLAGKTVDTTLTNLRDPVSGVKESIRRVREISPVAMKGGKKASHRSARSMSPRRR